MKIASETLYDDSLIGYGFGVSWSYEWYGAKQKPMNRCGETSADYQSPSYRINVYIIVNKNVSFMGRWIIFAE